MKVFKITLLCLCMLVLPTAADIAIPCKYNGKYVHAGEGYFDKCNICICQINGHFSCSKTKCVTPIDCRRNPCRNCGRCIRHRNGKYECVCPIAVYGDYCEKDPCNPNPCKDKAAVCNSTGHGGYCCTDRCHPNPCKWWETCKPTKYDGYCCTDPCKPNPCKFGACLPFGNGFYKCSGCVYRGKVYRPYQRFWIGCNICTCHANGVVSCTKRNCRTCTYRGKTYKYGAIIKIECNTCRCTGSGWVCTRMACIKPAKASSDKEE